MFFKGLQQFRETLEAVTALCKGLLAVVECALVHNVERFARLHPEKRWQIAELHVLATFPTRLEAFARKEKLTWETREPLSQLMTALSPALARGQKQCYGAVKVFLDLYAEGKELAAVEATIQRIPKPLDENKQLFDLLVKLLEAFPEGRVLLIAHMHNL